MKTVLKIALLLMSWHFMTKEVKSLNNVFHQEMASVNLSHNQFKGDL
jgi:hypothetical protein